MYFDKAFKTERIYKLVIGNTPSASINEISTYFTYLNELWHHRLRHVHYKRIGKMSNLELIPKFRSNTHEKCEICAQTKIVRKSFKKVSKSIEILELVNSDACDFESFTSRGEMKYFLPFIDNYSRYTFVYLRNSKDATFEKFMDFKARAERQIGRKLKRLRSDREGEYRSKEFTAFHTEYEIENETTTPYCLQLNGVTKM